MLTLLSILFAANTAATSAIHATIRGTEDPLIVTLLLRDRDLEQQWREITRRRIPPSQRQVDFDGLAAGVYQLRVQRSDGDEQAGTKIIVGAGEKRSAEIAIDPVEIAGSIALADVPLTKAVIKLKHTELQWQIAFPAGDDGKFHVRLWQRGSFEYLVHSPALAIPYHHLISFTGGTALRWDLRLPDRRVVGAVRDRLSGAPVAGTRLRVNSVMDEMTHHSGETTHHSGESKHHSITQAGTDGRFDLAAMEPSVVTIDASREGYLDGTSDPLTLTEADRLRETVVTLEPGSIISMTLRDAQGLPLNDASVLTVVDGAVRAWVVTGSDGSARVTMPRDRAATLYAVPRDGSFGVVHVAKAEDAPRRIMLPPATSSLRIVARTTDGKPLANVTFVMRANGELLPPAVAEALEVMQGLTLRTDERGEALLRKLPAGSYEFWPYSGESEAEAIAETVGSVDAPIVVNVKTGENAIAVNFRAR